MFEINLKKKLTQKMTIQMEVTVKNGEILVLTGKSGAGKSSLLNSIAGILTFDEGYIKNGETDITHLPLHKRRFGYIKQQSLLFPHLSPVQNMMYHARLPREKLDYFIDQFELRQHIGKKVSELSGGEAKRVAIVRTLMSDPQLLLLDEVFSSLDNKLRMKIRRFIKTDLNIPVILVTHDLEEADEMADRLAVVESGQVKLVEKIPISKKEISIGILAGGEGSRMGFIPKGMLTLGRQTFLETLVDEFCGFKEIVICVRDMKPYQHYPYRFILDETERIGPMGGLYTLLNQAKTELVFVCGVDMPLLKKELISYIELFIDSEHDAFVITSNHKYHPLCAIYKKKALVPLAGMIKEKKYRLMDFLGRLKTKSIPLEFSCFDERMIMNVNTPHDFNKLAAPKIFCISGVKNSGKTTLIVKLIKELKKCGLTVGTIKHDGHEFNIDHKGTDSYLHQEAGSEATIIYSKTQMAVIKKSPPPPIQDLIASISYLDVIFIEGLKDSKYPKIEMVLEKQICDERYVVAYATDNAFKHPSIPVYRRNDVNGLLNEVLRKAGV